MELVLQNVEIEGRRGLDVRIAGGRIVQLGCDLRAEYAIDGGGGALIPGLIDHHIHILASAARADTVTLDDVQGFEDACARLRRAAAGRPAGSWIRAAGYHEYHCGRLDRSRLDVIAPDHPVRVEHQTGSLWILNSRALAEVATPDAPPAVERDAVGSATGNVWRGELWLRQKLGNVAPPLAALGQSLATFGVTGLMDASATTDAVAAQVLAAAHRVKELPQRIALMSAGPLTAPSDGALRVGAVKFILDDDDLPDLDELVSSIANARLQARNLAIASNTAV